MIKIAPPLEYPRRRPRPKRQFGPPPSAANRILAVAPGSGEDEMIATTAGTVTWIDESDGRFQVLVGDDWVPAFGANFDTPGQVIFLFGSLVNTATAWRVPEPALWHFEGGGTLGEPLEGTIG